MRQTLFYISLDAPFSWNTAGSADRPLLTIGLGLLAILLILFSSLYLVWKNQSRANWTKLRATLLWNAIQIAGLAGLAILFSPMRTFPVFGYGMMLLIGFVSGASWAGLRAEKSGIPQEMIWDVAMLILVSGIMGARIFYLLQHGERVFTGVQTPLEWAQAAVNLSEGGLVLYGGVILGTIVYFVYCGLKKIHPLLLADIITPSILLGIGFGRIGCLLNGCCYGDRCELPWAITFPEGSVPFTALVKMGFLAPDAVASLPLHPSQIYSSLGGFLLAFVTATVFRYRQKSGEVLAVAAIFYPLNRFLIEFVRGDEFTQLNTGLTISQLISLGVFACGLIYLAWLTYYGRLLEFHPHSRFSKSLKDY